MSTLQIINICVAVASGIVWALWAKNNQDRWRYFVAPLSYAVHVVLFYICTALHLLPPIALNAWSGGIRLHGLLLVCGIGIALLYIERYKTWNPPK